MKNNNKPLIISLIIIISILFSACENKISNTDKQNVPNEKPILLDFVYGDELSGFYLTDYKGTEIKHLPKTSEYKVVFYLSQNCGTCIKLLRKFKFFSDMFSSDKLSCSIIWFDAIPNELIKKHKIPPEINYSLMEKHKLSFVSPTMYIVDKDNKVLFYESDLNNIIEKLKVDNIVNFKELIVKANTYIINKSNLVNKEKETVIMFSMDGCKDCAAAEKLIKSNNIEEKYNIIRIYRKEINDKLGIANEVSILKKIYSIDWYPTFIKVKNNGEYTITREVSEEEILNMFIDN